VRRGRGGPTGSLRTRARLRPDRPRPGSVQVGPSIGLGARAPAHRLGDLSVPGLPTAAMVYGWIDFTGSRLAPRSRHSTTRANTLCDLAVEARTALGAAAHNRLRNCVVERRHELSGVLLVNLVPAGSEFFCFVLGSTRMLAIVVAGPRVTVVAARVLKLPVGPARPRRSTRRQPSVERLRSARGGWRVGVARRPPPGR
jgi:hypothetical protein